jgi:transcriptional regulator with XRE-family HTH domain
VSVDVSEGNPLGEFLRARRELLDPSQFALPPDTGARRVAGLRRDEVAFLTGVSSHYYARLEQGRDRHPSDTILGALAQVFDLDAAAVGLLHRLAQQSPERRRRRAARETLSPRLARLLAGWPDNPAVIIGRYRDVLAANDLAQIVNPGFAPGRNLLHDTFLDPAARTIYLDWDDIAAGAVAGVRASAGDDPDDPRLRDLVGELSLKSEEFRRLWARHDVRERDSGEKRFDTALAGSLTLQYETFAVISAPGQTMFVFHADPGGKNEQTLRLLSSMIPDDTSTQTVETAARPT